MTDIRVAVVLVLGAAAGCTNIANEVTIEFASQEGLDATAEIAVTAFVPLLTPLDSDVPNFVDGSVVGVFPPSRLIDVASIETYPNLGKLLLTREVRAHPFDGDEWVLDVPSPDTADPDNPWGAVLLYFEARGPAVLSDDAGSLAAATLLTGWDCIRTRAASHTNQKLDRAIKAACRLVDEETDAPMIVDLAPVVPAVFDLGICEGLGSLTGTKNEELYPGPSVCVTTVKCDDVPDGSVPCFDCQPSCNDSDYLRNVPIVFTVDQAGGGVTPRQRIVITDDQGRARAPLQLDDCTSPIEVLAQVVGRTGAPVKITVDCVAPIEDVECPADLPLGAPGQPRSMTTIPSPVGACRADDLSTCDQIAVLLDDGTKSRLEVWHPRRATPIVYEFAERNALAVHGFFYDLGPDGRTPSRPAVAVAVSGVEINNVLNTDLHLYVFEFVDGVLTPHDGADGLLVSPCTGWFCGGTQVACENQTCGPTEYCYEGLCVSDESDAICAPPAGCTCSITSVPFGTRISIVDRDLDGDNRSDLAITADPRNGNQDSRLAFLFHRTGTAPATALYDTTQCECGRFGQASGTFALGRFGHDTPDPVLRDIFIGSQGGAAIKYADALPPTGRSILRCGDSTSLRYIGEIRDVVSRSLSCRIDDPSCVAYDDVVSVGEGEGLGSDDVGVVRVFFGSRADLSMGLEPFEAPSGGLELVPRLGADKTPPRVPQRIRFGDYNGDGHVDLAVHFSATSEVRLWLGASNRALGESPASIRFDDCAAKRSMDCSGLPEFASGDFDGDGVDEVVAVCNPPVEPSLRFFRPIPR